MGYQVCLAFQWQDLFPIKFKYDLYVQTSRFSIWHEVLSYGLTLKNSLGMSFFFYFVFFFWWFVCSTEAEHLIVVVFRFRLEEMGVFAIWNMTEIDESCSL